MRNVKSASAARAHRSVAVENKWEDWIATPAASPAGMRVSQPEVEISSPDVLRHRIAQLAYTYWESRGHQGGSAEQDWLRAEAEILGHTGR
jgi:hypothetical protein